MNLARAFLITTIMLSSTAHQAMAEVESVRQAIVNGSPSPRSVGLLAEEILAIGAIVPFSQTDDPFCTGTAITNRVVVTAAHCIQNDRTGIKKTAAEMAFVVGENPQFDGVVYEVADVFIHPNYDYQSGQGQIEDVAVLLLASDLSSQINLQPIEFNRHPLTGLDAEAMLSRKVEIAGYGRTDLSGAVNTSRSRLFTSVDVAEVTPLSVLIDGKGVTGACSGDSGGPVLTLNMRQAPVILGVLRGGSDNCVGQDHYVRLDVPVIRTWLEEQIRRTWVTYPEGAVCANLSYYGRCVEDYVEYCDDSYQVVRQDCRADATPKTCSFLDLESGYVCRPISSCQDGVCKSRFDGFLPPAPLQIDGVGGCMTSPPSEGYPLYGPVFLILLGLRFRIRRRRC